MLMFAGYLEAGLRARAELKVLLPVFRERVQQTTTTVRRVRGALLITQLAASAISAGRALAVIAADSLASSGAGAAAAAAAAAAGGQGATYGAIGKGAGFSGRGNDVVQGQKRGTRTAAPHTGANGSKETQQSSSRSGSAHAAGGSSRGSGGGGGTRTGGRRLVGGGFVSGAEAAAKGFAGRATNGRSKH